MKKQGIEAPTHILSYVFLCYILIPWLYSIWIMQIPEIKICLKPAQLLSSQVFRQLNGREELRQSTPEANQTCGPKAWPRWVNRPWMYRLVNHQNWGIDEVSLSGNYRESIGDISWYIYTYPLVNIQKAIENGPVESSLIYPLKIGGSFHSFLMCFVCLPEGILQ